MQPAVNHGHRAERGIIQLTIGSAPVPGAAIGVSPMVSVPVPPRNQTVVRLGWELIGGTPTRAGGTPALPGDTEGALLGMGSTPAPGVVDRALAVHPGDSNSRTVRKIHTRMSSARRRTERQPGRLRSPLLKIKPWTGWTVDLVGGTPTSAGEAPALPGRLKAELGLF